MFYYETENLEKLLKLNLRYDSGTYELWEIDVQDSLGIPQTVCCVVASIQSVINGNHLISLDSSSEIIKSVKTAKAIRLIRKISL